MHSRRTTVADRRTPGTGNAILAATRVAELAGLWLDAPHGWSTGTERTYRSVVRNQVLPALGDVRLRQVTAGRVTRAIRAIAEHHGPSAAKSARGCLSGMFVLDVPDLVDWMVATGCRIAEGLDLEQLPMMGFIFYPSFMTDLQEITTIIDGRWTAYADVRCGAEVIIAPRCLARR